jgi:hypothetical protein
VKSLWGVALVFGLLAADAAEFMGVASVAPPFAYSFPTGLIVVVVVGVLALGSSVAQQVLNQKKESAPPSTGSG